MPDIDDIWDDDEDMRMYAGESQQPDRPRLCRDIYESNANGLIADLRGKLAKVQSVRSSAKSGGDYEHTLTAYVRTIYAALDAAEKQFRLELERDQ